MLFAITVNPTTVNHAIAPRATNFWVKLLFPNENAIPFGNWTRSKQQFDGASGVEGHRLHDLRRTWATIAADELGVEPHIIESVLAHSSGTAVSRVYNRAKYLEPMRKALLAFEEWLQALLLKSEDTDGGRDIRDVRTA